MWANVLQVPLSASVTTTGSLKDMQTDDLDGVWMMHSG